MSKYVIDARKRAKRLIRGMHVAHLPTARLLRKMSDEIERLERVEVDLMTRLLVSEAKRAGLESVATKVEEPSALE